MDEETLQIDGQVHSSHEIKFVTFIKRTNLFCYTNICGMNFQIEEINVPLLNYFYENNDKLVVLFYESDDRDADEIIEGLEGSWKLKVTIPTSALRFKLSSEIHLHNLA